MTGDHVMLGPVRVERMLGAEAIGMVETALAARAPLHLGFCNAHTLQIAFERPDYAEVLARMVLLNDGIGTELAARLLTGRRFPENLNGTDFVPRLLGAIGPDLRIVLVGARAEVVAAAADRIATDHPRHAVVGWHHGFFQPDESDAVLDRIRSSRPDLVLVGMGNPRQEAFIVRHGAELAAPVVIGVGALFDFLAGAVPRAPRLVRSLRAEWLFRLALEPRRLGRRYTVEIARLLRALIRMRRTARRRSVGR